MADKGDDRRLGSANVAGNAWLALSKDAADYRRLVGSDRYDDDPATHYSWNSSVNNSDKVSEGDVIALWDLKTLLGVSVIESIATGEGTKRVSQCPECGRGNVVERAKKEPTYRCDDCKHEFWPTFITKDVTTYRSNHAQSWIDLEGSLTPRPFGSCA